MEGYKRLEVAVPDGGEGGDASASAAALRQPLEASSAAPAGHFLDHRLDRRRFNRERELAVGARSNCLEKDHKTLKLGSGSDRPRGKEHTPRPAADQAGVRTKHMSSGSSAAAVGEGTSFGLSLSLSSLPQSARWAAPGVAFLIGLFVQNAGLYLGTRTYVKWMDGVHRPTPNGTVAPPSNKATVLQDISQLLPAPGHHSDALTRLLGIITSCVPLLWFVWVTRTRNLRSWTQVMLSCTLFSLLKGFLAWSIIMPDSEGWEACRERLQKDGLKYYRRRLLFGAAASIDPLDINLSEALLDTLLLEIRGLWLLGVEHRDYFCGNAPFSCQLSHIALLCLSLNEAVRLSSRQLQARARSIVQNLCRVLLSLMVMANAVLAVVNRHHYSADILFALTLSVLVYGNPAMALAVQYWAQGPEPEHPKEASTLPVFMQEHAAASAPPIESMSSSSSSPRGVSSSAAASASAGPPAGLEGFPKEEGRVPLTPCCLFPSSLQLQHHVYLRGGAVQLPTEDISQDLRQYQLEHLRNQKAQLLRCRRLKEEQIVQAHTEAQNRSAQAAEAAQRRLQERLADQAAELEVEEKKLREELQKLCCGQDWVAFDSDSCELAAVSTSAANCSGGCLG